jgi:hypothetical protein
MLQLRLGNTLNLAQQFMRNISNFESVAQLLFEMNQQTCGHIRIS